MIQTTKALFNTLCLVLADHPEVCAVELAKTKPQMTLRLERAGTERRSKAVIPLAMDASDWQRWGRQATSEWWSVSCSELRVTVGVDVVPGQLLVYNPYRVWEDRGVEIYHHAGPNRIYWISEGLRDWEPISTALHGSYAVVSPTPLTELEKATYRDMITVTHPGTWRLPQATQDSTTLTANMVLSDCLPDGVARSMVDETANWLRTVLPAYKVGAPSMEDVRLKLELERRLRLEEKVVGSARPLAFTLQAIDDITFPWPGLWLVSGTHEDFRTDLPVLLAWDATLAAVSAIARLHVDVKPGLCYGSAFSQSILRSERRFSKRDVGATEGAYSQVNPARIVGPAPVVASRLLQAATHELSHLVLRQLQPHSEIFTARREQLFLTATDLLPVLIDLVQRLGLDQRPSRTVPVSPVTLDQWLHETLLDTPIVPVDHLVQSWAAVRNLTDGRAQRDVEDALAALVATGRFDWSSGNAYVVNVERSTFAKP